MRSMGSFPALFPVVSPDAPAVPLVTIGTQVFTNSISDITALLQTVQSQTSSQAAQQTIANAATMFANLVGINYWNSIYKDPGVPVYCFYGALYFADIKANAPPT